MKKLLLGLFLATVAVSAFADTITGKIINTVQDDEGVNIILQNVNDKKTITTHYLNSQSSNFIESYAVLADAKDNNQTVVIEVSQSDKTKVLNVKIKK